MTITEAAQRRLEALRHKAAKGCIGFRFEGALGTCSLSKPVLTPVSEPVPGAREFRAGDVILFACDELADILEQATFEVDEGVLFGHGLTVSWPHREQGCPNCR